MSSLDDAFEQDPYWAPYDHRMAFELALGIYPLEQILERYNCPREKFSKLLKTPAFTDQLAAYKREIQEKGLSFRAKARVMAEDLLGKAYELIHHAATPPMVKADLIKWTTKIADFEPKQDGMEQNLLPAITSRLKQIPDSELEVQVLRIVQRKKQQEPSFVVEQTEVQ